MNGLISGKQTFDQIDAGKEGKARIRTRCWRWHGRLILVIFLPFPPSFSHPSILRPPPPSPLYPSISSPLLALPKYKATEARPTEAEENEGPFSKRTILLPSPPPPPTYWVLLSLPPRIVCSNGKKGKKLGLLLLLPLYNVFRFYFLSFSVVSLPILLLLFSPTFMQTLALMDRAGSLSSSLCPLACILLVSQRKRGPLLKLTPAQKHFFSSVSPLCQSRVIVLPPRLIKFSNNLDLRGIIQRCLLSF